MRVRPSREFDIPAMSEIYGHHVRHGVASFETDPPGDTNNPASLRLQARFRFRHVGVLQAGGFKFGR